MSTCGSREQLAHYLRDELDDRQREVCSTHIENCAVCQSLLDELTNESLATSLRAAIQQPSTDEVALIERFKLQLITFLAREAARVGPDGVEDERSDLGAVGSTVNAINGIGSSRTERVSPAIDRSSVRGEIVRGGMGEASDTLIVDQSRIGRYRIVRQLGQGRFGQVYLAQDDELSRPVAIKVPNPERVARARRRGGLPERGPYPRQLDHPNIVPVYDVGRTDDGLCYVVSKFIEGSDLADRDPTGSSSFRESAETGCRGRRGLALRPHPRAGPPGHQARQYPDRRVRQAVRGGLRAGASETRISAREPGSPGRPPT